MSVRHEAPSKVRARSRGRHSKARVPRSEPRTHRRLSNQNRSVGLVGDVASVSNASCSERRSLLSDHGRLQRDHALSVGPQQNLNVPLDHRQGLNALRDHSLNELRDQRHKLNAPHSQRSSRLKASVLAAQRNDHNSKSNKVRLLRLNQVAGARAKAGSRNTLTTDLTD